MEGQDPKSVEEVFTDLKGRRAGIIKALTTEVEVFYQQCDPEKENLCLYGLPSEIWKVIPAEDLPLKFPKPALKINCARDGMPKKDWLGVIAVHSDIWLHSMARYFGAKINLNKHDRERLVNYIKELPKMLDVVTGNVKDQGKERSSVTTHSNKESKSNLKGNKTVKPKDEKERLAEEDEEVEEEDHGDSLCGACKENDGRDDFQT